jgi:arabinose-5-phosphate isomerase
VETARKVLEIEAMAVRALVPRIDESFTRAVEKIFLCEGRIVVTGMGKSGIIGKKMAATFASTGTPAFFLHPAEAVHGDLGMIVDKDVVIAISYTGHTNELVKLLERIKRLAVTLITITGHPESVLALHSDIVLNIAIKEEACPLGLVPTASTTASLAMGDALAIALQKKRGFTVEDFAAVHPAGSLGKKLMKIEQLMHKGDQVPIVPADMRMKDVLLEMTRKKLGMTTVVDENNRLVGIITDGDLRRGLENMKDVLEQPASACMTRDPRLIDRDTLAVQALNIMEEAKITSLVIKAGDGTVAGVIHLHDLWKTEMF